MFEDYKEWQEQRLGKITASNIYKIMNSGKGSYFSQIGETYLLSRVAEIMTMEQVDGERINTDSMEWGNSQEPYAIKEFEKRYKDLIVTYYGVVNPKFVEYNDMCGGSPDAIFTTQTGDGGIIEIKCPSNSTEHIRHRKKVRCPASLLELSPKYYWQMVANMLFTETRIGYFVSYDPRMVHDKLKLHVVPIEPLEGHIDLLKERIHNACKWINEDINQLITKV
jgi:hypothetical protein